MLKIDRDYLYDKKRYQAKLNEYGRKSYAKNYKDNDDYSQKKKEYVFHYLIR